MVDQGSFADRMGELENAQPALVPFQLQTLETRPLPGNPDPATVRQLRQQKKAEFDQKYAELSTFVDGRMIFFPCTMPNRRMAAQRGWFSCAMRIEEDHGVAIAKAFGKDEHRDRWWCKRLIIKKEAKSVILRKLWQMNITGETLFCTLDGLGRSMSELVGLLKPEANIGFALQDGLLTTTSNR